MRRPPFLASVLRCSPLPPLTKTILFDSCPTPTSLQKRDAPVQTKKVEYAPFFKETTAPDGGMYASSTFCFLLIFLGLYYVIKSPALAIVSAVIFVLCCFLSYWASGSHYLVFNEREGTVEIARGRLCNRFWKREVIGNLNQFKGLRVEKLRKKATEPQSEL